MRAVIRSLITLLLFAGVLCSQPQDPLPECEWCGADEAPNDVSWETNIADENEEGERLTITGTVLHTDGNTPAPDVIIYFYHTNNKGIYPKRGNETGNGRRHGYLRGWVKTNKNGEYRVNTIRPVSYPDGTEPAHIHIAVKEPDKDEYWIDPIIFEGDPLITPEFMRRIENRGGSGIMKLIQKGNMLYGVKNIILLN